MPTGWARTADGIAAAVDVLALAPLLDLEVRKLSAGQRRRLALARLIAAPRAAVAAGRAASPRWTPRWRAAFGLLMRPIWTAAA